MDFLVYVQSLSLSYEQVPKYVQLLSEKQHLTYASQLHTFTPSSMIDILVVEKEGGVLPQD